MPRGDSSQVKAPRLAGDTRVRDPPTRQAPRRYEEAGLTGESDAGVDSVGRGVGSAGGLDPGVGLESGGALGDADGSTDGVGVGVGVGVGLGLGAGAQPPTPLPATAPEDGLGRPYAVSGSWPSTGKSLAASARIPSTSGIWMEPRTSKPELTSGWLTTAR